jgi:hypothetical protein
MMNQCFFSDTSSDVTVVISCSESICYHFLIFLSPFIYIDITIFKDYIAVKEKNAKYLPHSAGRYAAKRFRKAQCPIVERLTNSLMMHGRNNGKKLMAVRIVKHAFEIIHLLTGENPLQVNNTFCSISLFLI